MSEGEVHMFGARLRQARMSAGLSQEGLAERVGVSARTVINWERGVNLPEMARLPAIARATHMTEAWFFTPDGERGEAVSLVELDRKLDRILMLLENR